MHCCQCFVSSLTVNETPINSEATFVSRQAIVFIGHRFYLSVEQHRYVIDRVVRSRPNVDSLIFVIYFPFVSSLFYWRETNERIFSSPYTLYVSLLRQVFTFVLVRNMNSSCPILSMILESPSFDVVISATLE